MSAQTKTFWKKMYNPDYLGAYVLEPGQEMNLTIDRVEQESVPSPEGKREMCLVAHFRERGVKPMVLNKTNCKTIRSLHGSPYIEDWAGKMITVYAKEVKAFGQLTDALRIRPRIPQITKENMTPSHPRWNEAREAVQSGRTTVNGIRKTYNLSKEHETLLAGEAHAEA